MSQDGDPCKVMDGSFVCFRSLLEWSDVIVVDVEVNARMILWYSRHQYPLRFVWIGNLDSVASGTAHVTPLAKDDTTPVSGLKFHRVSVESYLAVDEMATH